MQTPPHIWVHALVSAGFVLWMYFGVYRPHRSHSAAPSELTTYGILGTFTGILLGLLPFLFSQQTDITQHIQDLISGIAVAAVCSIAGMALALRAKNIQRKEREAEESSRNQQHEGATADTLADLLQQLLQQAVAGKAHSEMVAAQTQEQNKHLVTIQKSLVGDGDGTLITQMQKMRTSFNDRQDQLIESFESFAKNMTQSNNDALIQALNEVIRDFNNKISEQFGENFKHLNEAVGQLLQWQENYRTEVSQLQDQFKRCLEGIDSADRSLGSISGNAKSVLEASQRLEKLLLTYESHESRLSSNLEAFARLSESAQNAFPVIEGNLKQLTEEFSTAVRNSTAQVEQTVNKTSRLLEEQVAKLDEALEAELTNSLKTMANQLASLSSKFVADYTPLTIQLERLVQLSAKAGSN